MSKKTDYIPSKDAEFNTFQDDFMTIVQPKLNAWNIPAAAFTVLQNEQITWNTAYGVAKNVNNRSRSDVLAKDTARESYEKELREFVQEHLAHNSDVSNTNRKKLGITVRDTERTRVQVPSNSPRISIDKIENMRHTLLITNPKNPKSRSKPKGVRAVQIFRFIGDEPPNDTKQYRFTGNATRARFISEFKTADAGKTAFYIARYENTRGETGPWSEYVKETIA